jgi:hypothetical protein
MNKLILCCFIATLIAAVSCQQGFGYPIPDLRDPKHPCNQPGANCNIQSRFAEESSVTDDKGKSTKWSRICDEQGCTEVRVSNGDSRIGASFLLLTIAAFVASIKNLI